MRHLLPHDPLGITCSAGSWVKGMDVVFIKVVTVAIVIPKNGTFARNVRVVSERKGPRPKTRITPTSHLSLRVLFYRQDDAVTAANFTRYLDVRFAFVGEARDLYRVLFD